MDSKVSTCSDAVFGFWGGEGRIQQDVLINRAHPPFPKTKEAGAGGCVMCETLKTREASTHMTEQLLAFSFLKVEVSRSDLLGRCRSLLERRRVGLGLGTGCSLLMQASAAVRKTLWILFSDVNAEHSR